MKVTDEKKGFRKSKNRTYNPLDVQEFDRKLKELLDAGYPPVQLHNDTGIPYSVINRQSSNISVLKYNLNKIRKAHKYIEFYKTKYKLIEIGNQFGVSKPYFELEILGFSQWEISRLKK